MSRTLLAAAFLWLSASEVFASEVAFEKILVENDPRAAVEFLRDAKTKYEGRVDADLYGRVFTRSVELKDVDDLLNGIPNARPYRVGLDARRGCEFCQNPERLLGWAQKFTRGYEPDRKRELSRALHEWSTMNQAQRNWLGGHGQAEASWAALDLPTREERMSPWILETFESMMKETPSNQAALEEYRTRARYLGTMLAPGPYLQMWGRIDAMDARLSGLEKAQQATAKSADPKLAQLLAQARATTDPQASLDVLNRLFEAAGKHDAAVAAAAPSREDQQFDAAGRQRVAALLATGLMRETEGTHAGDELSRFFKNHFLEIRVAQTKDGTNAGEGEGVVTFNEQTISEYVKARGRGLDALATDPELLRGLTIELSPLWVHEATHGRQEAWIADNHLQEMSGQHLELEAMQTEALFIIEKCRRDRSFLKRLEEDAPSSVLARQSLSKANQLLTEGPANYRAYVKAWHYADDLSLEGNVWTRINVNRAAVAEAKKELARRERLPAAEQTAIEKAPGFTGTITGLDQWRAQLAAAGTPFLRASVQANFDWTRVWQDNYDAYAKREEQVDEAVETQLAEIKRSGTKIRRIHSGVEVPSP